MRTALYGKDGFDMFTRLVKIICRFSLYGHCGNTGHCG